MPQIVLTAQHRGGSAPRASLAVALLAACARSPSGRRGQREEATPFVALVGLLATGTKLNGEVERPPM
jgi:hypothetical protein